jgi:hypothetical protein
MASKKRQDYINNFNKEHYTIIRVVVPKADTEVLEKLATVKSKSGYIVELIKKDLQK